MQLKITITAQQLEYMRELLRVGLHGPDIEEIGRNLILKGLRSAMCDGLISVPGGSRSEAR